MWFWLFAEAPGSANPDDMKPNRPVPQPKPTVQSGGNPGPDDDDDEPTVAGEVNDVLRTMLPWLSSLLFHLGIIVLALFLVWSVMIVEEEDAPIVPVARLAEDAGGQLSESQDVELQASQQQRKVVTDSVATDDSVSTLQATNKNKLELVGLSAGGGGKMAPFGTTTGGGGGISAKFFGSGGNARQIIYIVDASGSLIDTLPFVIKELKRSISELSEKQQFTIIFFQAGREVEVPPRGWKTATADMKQRVANWITLEQGNIIPRGSTDPVPAIRLAMNYKPQLVFILSDNITGKGRYEVDRSDLLKLLEEANNDKKIKINTIQFLYPDPLNTLKTIAEEHGGVYKFITEADLGLQ